ncbi:E3 ubiquitin-protein ligase RHF2A-like isoform X3 [Henckelia pumila]|uniref:E3 ubiquitin-protein ligase RHF2A-like isoform X3 n=1 Tax=Henckelia pumila TaxID=405737 RepID=UPI003C6E4949
MVFGIRGKSIPEFVGFDCRVPNSCPNYRFSWSFSSSMEVLGLDEFKNGESHTASAAAFVEGGIQEACDDACSICLEAFCDCDPSSVTSCKHEFHLQCILEWSQRSSNCPMCWQPFSLKDPSSQELLEAVERERKLSFTSSRRNATLFHHPALGDLELQHILLLPKQLQMGVDDPEFEDRIIEHLAVAAMGRTHLIASREGSRSRSSTQGHPQFVVLSSHPNASSSGQVSASLASVGTETDLTSATETNTSVPPTSIRKEVQPRTSSHPNDHVLASGSGSPVIPNTWQGIPCDNRAGPSELQSFSESWKSRLNSVSTRYKESITKSTRGWKEKLFSRSGSMAEIGNEVRREVSAGIATISHLMERLETRDSNRPGHVPLANDVVDSSGTGLRNPENRDIHNETSSTDINSSSCVTSSI